MRIGAPWPARIFALLIGAVCLFQLSLALGAPLGRFAMGGAFPGVFPPAMRFVALVQIAALIAMALVVLSRAALMLPAWRTASSRLVWGVVLFSALAVVLNLVTPSPIERLIWTPIAALLLLTSTLVAVSP